MQALRPQAALSLSDFFTGPSYHRPQPCPQPPQVWNTSITTDDELREFLASNDIDCHELDFLSGGCSNYCWRLTNRTGRRSILKHAEPHLRVTPEVQIPAERLDYEYAALTTIPSLIRQNESVRLPQVFHYFRRDRVIDMLDGGSQTLKEASTSDTNLDVPKLGSRIGSWLAGLHNATSTTQIRTSIKRHFDNKTAKLLSRISYNNLGAIFDAYGHDADLATRIDQKFGLSLETDEDCLCHGDFWPGNLLVDDQDPDARYKTRAPILTVTDWEMARLGNGATDVGQFAAQAWLLDRFGGSRGLMEAFIMSYLSVRPLTMKDKIRLTVHFAVHLAFYAPAGQWTDEQGVREIVDVAVEILQAVDMVRLHKLKAGPMKMLFK